MKRYNLKTKVTIVQNMLAMNREHHSEGHMEESENGRWVLWSEVEQLREEMEKQNPFSRLDKLEKAVGLTK